MRRPSARRANRRVVRAARFLLAAGTLLLLAAPAAARIEAVQFGPTLSQPTYLTAPPGDTSRVFVTELSGDIEILDAATGAINPASFLSISGVTDEGLQGLAFHPDYATNGFFYVYYYSSGTSVLERYTVSGGDPDLADSGSALTILEITQPFSNHNGGWIGFGPDEYLYVTVGDGGSQHDPSDYGQSITGELFGNILRLDVDGDDFPADPDRNYAIPSDNPFVGVTGEDEIWAYGLRNPFRASFDSGTGDFYIADVGQNTREEVNYQPASSVGGENYGWRLREGTIATPTGGVGGPQPSDGVDPVYDYLHGTGDDEGASITGGYVYRGPISLLTRKYFFADFENDRIWSIEHDGSSVTEFRDWTNLLSGGAIESIVGFGEDGVGNLYIVDFGGEVYKVISTAPSMGRTALAALAATLTLAAWLSLAARPRQKWMRRPAVCQDSTKV